ncbi:MAG: MCP four helix bundle domain-containing protein [Desulfobacteraceae bacterium]|uniref:histidine kinase n=1 Tax=Candidatus Desulfacyla euxinica TaxID=2841693 RepID=A0A8J6MXD8_9DELT|nr:MCP four helix bundle domain-containing protein [Candidatus Desulfacyla euxinica]MBL6978023.1 MCP four helix bundle domain-containing protein [Desulfobacteraceae bacterium]
MKSTIAKKLWGSFGVLIAVLTICGVIVYWQIHGINRVIEQLVEVREPLQEIILEMEINMGNTSRAVMGYVMERDPSHVKWLHDSEKEFEGLVSDFRELAETEEEKRFHREASLFFAEFRKLSHDIVALVNEQHDAQRVFREAAREIDESIGKALERVVNSSPGWTKAKEEVTLNMQICSHEVFAAIERYLFQHTGFHRDEVKSAEQAFREFRKMYRKTGLSDEESHAIRLIDRDYNHAIKVGYDAMAVTDQLYVKLDRFRDDLTRMDTVLNKDIQPLIHADTVRATEDSKRSVSIASTITLTMVISALIIMALVTWIITKGIIASVRRLKEGSEEFGRGALDHKIDVRTKDELSELATAFNQMAEKRKKAEDELKQSSEKIKLFAYSVSHDLKSPAMGIYGLTRLLNKNYGDILGKKGKTHCEQILKASEQIGTLVEEINLYISTKERPLSIEKTEIEEILEVVREEVMGRLIARKIAWSEPEDMPEIKVDKLSIIRVIRNLVDNAIKYGGDDLKEIKIGYRESDETHIISVTDDGVGLKAEDSEEIFELFKRKNTSKGVQGTGLGLAIVKEIVERHGGKVWIEPGAEKGTTFSVSISKHL